MSSWQLNLPLQSLEQMDRIFVIFISNGNRRHVLGYSSSSLSPLLWRCEGWCWLHGSEFRIDWERGLLPCLCLSRPYKHMCAHTHARMHIGLEFGEFGVLKLRLSGPGAVCTSLGMNGQILVCTWWVGERHQELHD